MDYIFTSERLGFRKWTAADAEPFFLINSDSLVMEFFPATLSRDQSDDYLKKINPFFSANNYGPYAVELIESKQFIGFIGFWHPSFESDFTPCIEIAWRLSPVHWRKGYASEGAKACLQYGFDKLGFDTVYSFTSILNKPSERVMQKIGMQKLKTFDHPSLEKDHHLCRHVLYSINRTSE